MKMYVSLKLNVNAETILFCGRILEAPTMDPKTH